MEFDLSPPTERVDRKDAGSDMREFLSKNEVIKGSSWRDVGTPGGRHWWVLGQSDKAKGWVTPNTQDARGAGSLRTRAEGKQMQLHQQVKFVMWPTPNANDGGSQVTHRGEGTRVKLLGRAKMQLGQPGSGLLNPKWVAQLMGVPEDWLEIGAV